MTKDEALKLALEALEEAWYHVGTFQPTEKAIDLYDEAKTAIKEALANEALEKKAENARELGLNYEPEWTPERIAGMSRLKEAQDKKLAQPSVSVEQEPVAWEQFYPDMGKPKLAYLSPTESPDNACYIPPQRTWVGLTEDDKVLIKHDANFNQFMTAGEYADRVQQLTEARLKDLNT